VAPKPHVPERVQFGVVRDPMDAVVQDIEVVLLRSRPDGVGRLDVESKARTRTDSLGEWRLSLDALDTASHVLLAHRPGVRSHQVQVVARTAPDGDRPVVIRVYPTARVRVTVRDGARGGAAPGCLVRLTSAYDIVDRPDQEAVTDQGGVCQFEAAVGPLVVASVAPDGTFVGEAIELSPDGADVHLELPAERRSIEFVVPPRPDAPNVSPGAVEHVEFVAGTSQVLFAVPPAGVRLKRMVHASWDAPCRLTLRPAGEGSSFSIQWPKLSQAAPDGVLRLDRNARVAIHLEFVEAGTAQALPKLACEARGARDSTVTRFTTDEQGRADVPLPPARHELLCNGSQVGHVDVAPSGDAAARIEVRGWSRLGGQVEGMPSGHRFPLRVHLRSRRPRTDVPDPAHPWSKTLDLETDGEGRWLGSVAWPSGTDLDAVARRRSENFTSSEAVTGGQTDCVLRWRAPALYRARIRVTTPDAKFPVGSLCLWRVIDGVAVPSLEELAERGGFERTARIDPESGIADFPTLPAGRYRAFRSLSIQGKRLVAIPGELGVDQPDVLFEVASPR
jgi:hypothetical protein